MNYLMECQLDSNIVTKRKRGYLSCNKHFKVLQNKKNFFFHYCGGFLMQGT